MIYKRWSLPRLNSDATPVLSRLLIFMYGQHFVRVIGHVAADHVMYIVVVSFTAVKPLTSLSLWSNCSCILNVL